MLCMMQGCQLRVILLLQSERDAFTGGYINRSANMYTVQYSTGTDDGHFFLSVLSYIGLSCCRAFQYRNEGMTICWSYQCCGSESEIIRKFWLDPNPKKKFGYGFGFRHCCRKKICVKNHKSNTWKRKILYFSIENFYSLKYMFQNTYSSN
jgi:hypothetical protein